MQVANKKIITLLIALVAVTFFSGCTNWEKKYGNLQVAYQNLEGRFEFERARKGQLESELVQGQQTIEQLQRKIAELDQTPAQVTGFGPGYDVSLDAAAGTITVTLPNAILFDSGKATLKKKTSVELDHIASVLKSTYPGRQIDVVGHTDADPIKKSKWKDNWELSAQRSLSVVRYLRSRGISAGLIRAVGCGSARALASNASASGKAKNRRVEIVVYVR